MGEMVPSHSPCRDRDSEPQGDSSHMHGCSRGGQAQVLGSMSSLHASNQLDQSVRWVWGSVQSELSKGRALELRHRVRFLKDKTAWSSAAVTAPRIVQAESGALPACFSLSSVFSWPSMFPFISVPQSSIAWAIILRPRIPAFPALPAPCSSQARRFCLPVHSGATFFGSTPAGPAPSGPPSWTPLPVRPHLFPARSFRLSPGLFKPRLPGGALPGPCAPLRGVSFLDSPPPLPLAQGPLIFSGLPCQAPPLLVPALSRPRLPPATRRIVGALRGRIRRGRGAGSWGSSRAQACWPPWGRGC